MELQHECLWLDAFANFRLGPLSTRQRTACVMNQATCSRRIELCVVRRAAGRVLGRAHLCVSVGWLLRAGGSACDPVDIDGNGPGEVERLFIDAADEEQVTTVVISRSELEGEVIHRVGTPNGDRSDDSRPTADQGSVRPLRCRIWPASRASAQPTRPSTVASHTSHSATTARGR
jgi:hypothetical protein